MNSINVIFAEAKNQLKTAGIDNPELDARLLMQEAFNISYEEILLDNNIDIDESKIKSLKDFIARRTNREPVSRILGKRDFWKHSFKVSDETLDPRPDSETIVEAVLAATSKDKELDILDLGTGTGCLLLSVLYELPKAKGLGVDISDGAISTAKENATSMELLERCELIASDWNDIDWGRQFDVVISNPPYIENMEIENLQPEVKDFDPYRALAGGEAGLDCYKSIISLLPKILKKNGKIFFEIGYNQKEDVNRMLAEAGFFVVENIPDLAGHPRCTVAKWG